MRCDGAQIRFAPTSDFLFQEGKELQAKLNISGMHCESCAADIKETLEETAGVTAADVNYNGRQATIDFDDRVVQTATLIKKIQDLNYGATITEGEPTGA